MHNPVNLKETGELMVEAGVVLGTERAERAGRSLFKVFCLWTFVLLCRPQDIVPVLNAIRPALSIGLLTIFMIFLHKNYIAGPKFKDNKQVRLFSWLILIMILGIPFSFYPRYSFVTIFTDYMNVIVFFFIFYKMINSVARLKTILLVGCIGTGLYSAFAIVTGSLGSGRLVFGGMFDPNDLAFFGLAFLPLNLLFISRGNPLMARLACIFSFGSGTLLILLTGSRAGFLAFASAAALLLLTKTRTVGMSQKLLFVSMCIVFVAISQVNFDRYKTLLTVENDYNVVSETGRLALWDIGMRAFLTHPLTGVGVNCFNEAVGRDRQTRGLQMQSWQTAHNSIIQIGTETGFLGLFLFLLMTLNVFRIFGLIKRFAGDRDLVKVGEMAMVAFTGLFISGMFLSQAYSIYWAFYVVLSAVLQRLFAVEEVTVEDPDLKVPGVQRKEAPCPVNSKF